MTRGIDPSLIPSAPDLEYEQGLWQAGFKYITGIDEAGRGALAGPVAAGALILPANTAIARNLGCVRDSKQMTPTAREACREHILQVALAWAVGLASAQEIDELGILPATRLAARRALQALACQADHLLLDFLLLPELSIPQTALIKGDCRSISIAGASILAKTERDALMREFEVAHPGYGFARHKGYGTAVHRAAIQRLGLCAIHRRTFRFKEIETRR